MWKSMRKSCSSSSSKPKASPIEFALSRRALQRLRDLFYFTPFFSSNTDLSAVLMQMVEFLWSTCVVVWAGEIRVCIRLCISGEHGKDCYVPVHLWIFIQQILTWKYLENICFISPIRWFPVCNHKPLYPLLAVKFIIGGLEMWGWGTGWESFLFHLSGSCKHFQSWETFKKTSWIIHGSGG